MDAPSTSAIQIDMHIVVTAASETPALASLASNTHFSFLIIRVRFLHLSIFKTNLSRQSESWSFCFSHSQVLCHRHFFQAKPRRQGGELGLQWNPLRFYHSLAVWSSASYWPFLSVIILVYKTGIRSNWLPRPLGKLEDSWLSICHTGDTQMLASALLLVRPELTK